MWITQQADKAYAQDISNSGAAHISFLKKETIESENAMKFSEPENFLEVSVIQGSHMSGRKSAAG